MTQISRVQPGHINSLPTSDVGPYSADQWAKMYRVLFTGDRHASQGVFATYINELEVAESPAGQINVDTGGGLCNGHWFDNDVSVAFTPSAPAANPRIDVVVMIENNTAIQRTAGIATANNLIFPTVLTDYGGSASLEPFTCRLAILPGNEAGAPVAPTLDVDSATLFMVPLAQYQIAVGGAISSLISLRKPANTPTGTMVKLAEVDADGSSASISFTNISQIYTHLRIIGSGSSNSPVATAADPVIMRFNNSSAAIYNYLKELTIQTAGMTPTFQTGQTSFDIGDATGLIVSSLYQDYYLIDVPNYTKVFDYKSVMAMKSGWTGGSTSRVESLRLSGWFFDNLNPISRIDLILSFSTWDTSSLFTLYGIA